MTIFGKPLSTYVSFVKPFLILVLIVGITRLALSLSGVSNSSAKWFSVTALVWLAAFYFSVRVHTTGFGSYKQLLVICALLNLTAQVVIVTGILIAIFTGTGNIFSAPEYSFGSNAQWVHVGAHLVVGTTAGSLVPWAVGSLVLALTKRGSNHERTRRVPQF